MKKISYLEFKELVKEAINCLVTQKRAKYRLSSGEVLIDYGNEQYKSEVE